MKKINNLFYIFIILFLYINNVQSFYTHFNLTSPTCDVTLQAKDCQDACGTKVRIAPVPAKKNKFYFCPGDLANCENSNTPPTNLCWIVSCAPYNKSYRVDENYLFLCIYDENNKDSSENSSFSTIKEMEIKKYIDQTQITNFLKKTFFYGFIPFILYKGYKSMKNPNLIELFLGPIGYMEQF